MRVPSKPITALLLAVALSAAGEPVVSPAAEYLRQLKATAKSPSFDFAWTHVWMSPWDARGDLGFVTEENGVYRAKPLSEIKLENEISEATGVRPRLYYSDLAGLVGTWHRKSCYDVNRAGFSAVIRKAWKEYRGVCVFSWHMDHPCTTNGFRQCAYRYKCREHKDVIGAILRDEQWECGRGVLAPKMRESGFASPRAWMMRQFEDVANFVNSLNDERGNPIPVIIRYPHEMDGDWFWWGKGWCTPSEFIAFCRLEANTLRHLCGPNRILFAYDPDRTWKELGAPNDGGHNFLTWYPGDEYVDIVGFDDYSIGCGKSDAEADKNTAESIRKLRLVSEFASDHDKVAALTETGVNKPTRDDFYGRLLKILTAEGVRVAFADTWGGRYTMPKDRPAIVEGLKLFIRDPRVLVDRLQPSVKVVCTRPSHRYAPGESAEFEVSAPTPGVPVKVSFSRAYLPPHETLVTTTPARVSFKLGEPGFIVCNVQAKRSDGKDGDVVRAGAGFDVGNIRTALPRPGDYDEFWKRAFAEQDAIEPDFRTVAYSNDVELLSCRTVQGTRMYAFLHVPKTGKPCPLRVSVGGGDSIRSVNSEVRGGRSKSTAFLDIHLPPWEPTALTDAEAKARHDAWKKANGTRSLYRWKSDAKDPRERWYYRCILGSCRLIDYAVKRQGVDLRKVYYTGSSTGGGYGFFLAAFSPHFCAAVCEVPNYGNAGGPSLGRPSGEDDRGEHWQTSLYYDAAYCAPRIRCPTFVSCGYIDNSCVPETVYCTYNALTCEKTMFDKVEHGHGGSYPPNYHPTKNAWLESILAR